MTATNVKTVQAPQGYRPFGDPRMATDVLVGFGFYPAETDGRNWWRWTGPGQLAQIRVAVATPGRKRVAIWCERAPPSILDGLALRCCGKEVAHEIEAKNGAANITCEAELPEAGFTGWLDLELMHGLPNPGADGRALGLCVGSIRLEECEAGEGPTQAEVDSLFWWHPFTFPNGVKARGRKGGGDGEQCEVIVHAEEQVVFKYPVQGKTVLDIGAWNGYFSVEAVRRGATRVVALDKPTWEHPDYQGFKTFELVRRYLAPQIEAVSRDVMDLRFEPVGEFDCVLFLGILYHLKHPLYVLETLFDLTLEHLVVETAIDLIDYPRPGMVYYPRTELAGDPSNWWGPNVQCVVEMLQTVGFSRVEHVAHPLYHGRAFFHAFK